MVFSSVVFLFFFLPITLAGYYFINPRYRNYWLLFVSLVFFAWSQPDYLWMILLNVAINYSVSILIEGCAKLRKPVLITAVAANLAILFYFKYFDFVVDSVNKLLNQSFELKNIILPIGISFFTFQGMSYTIDVYRKQVPAQKNPLKVALYITLFPQLIAGPIVRYTDIMAEIDDRLITLDDFSSGIERFIIGLGKKAIIANTMAACVDSIWTAGIEHNTWNTLLIGSIAYTLQIYFDFSGYSDMAIGLGRMFGFHFNENFNLPYVSQSVSEFWRRWHISLSSWFRDYVYIPLGGNRKHVYLNLAIVFLLTGIWHGASWHFVVWGGINGAFILLERWLKNKKKDTEKEKKKTQVIIKHLYTLFIVNVGWIFFRAPCIKDAVKYIVSMFGILKPKYVDFTVFWYFDRWTMSVMIIAVIFASSLPNQFYNFVKKRFSGEVSVKAFRIMKYILLIFLLYLSMLRIVSGTYNPFIYFQF